ncbi:MAG: TonB-dependent receptor [Bacteroidetes bacterium]|nr:TonB-dependent receptor [Bacteroidota bacterium]
MILLTIPGGIPALAGNEGPDSARTFIADPVVITGTQTSMALRFVPASISTITSSQLDQTGKLSLLDAVSEEVPGVFVTQRGVIGFGINNPAGTITIRGVGGSPNTQVLVMIDGVPQFMGLFGHPFPDAYLSENAERVEVIRGPASVLYGTNAMGGVVNIITKKQTARGLTFSGTSSYGTFDTQEYTAGVGYRKGNLDILVTGGHDETAGHRAYSGYNMNNGYLNGAYKVSRALSIRLSGNINGFRTFDPGPAASPKIDNWFEVMRSSGSVSLENQLAILDGSLRLFYNYGDHDVFDGFHSIDRNLGAVFYQNIRATEGNVSTFGVDYQHYGGVAVNDVSRMDFGRHFMDEAGVYALVQQLLMNSVMLNAGARLQRNGAYGSELVPQVGIAWSIEPSSTLKMSVSKGFRSPTIRELYLFPTHNESLQPERLWNYEVGMMQSFDGIARFEVTGFLAQGSNLILMEGVAPSLWWTNSGSFTHKGLEFSGHYIPIEGVRLAASYSYVDPGEQTYATPKHKLYLGCSYSRDGFDLGLTLQQIAELYGGDNYQNRLPDYTLVGLRAGYRITEFAYAFVSGRNLLNTSYQTIYDYPMPGRVLRAGVRLKLGAD